MFGPDQRDLGRPDIDLVLGREADAATDDCLRLKRTRGIVELDLPFDAPAGELVEDAHYASSRSFSTFASDIAAAEPARLASETAIAAIVTPGGRLSAPCLALEAPKRGLAMLIESPSLLAHGRRNSRHVARGPRAKGDGIVRRERASVTAVLFMLVTGCGGPAPPATPGAAGPSTTAPSPAAGESAPIDAGPTWATPTGPSTDLGELAWIFETPAAPFDVAVELDDDRTAEALIPLDGGSISATGADGTVYTLEIPEDALLSETMIGLTPVTSVAAMPFGGEQTYAVQLSPEGLFLQNFAILTITPAADIPLGEQIVFGYQEQGSDLILAAPVVDSSEIKINVLHFSGNGVTKGFLADIEPVRERLGGDAERRLQSAISEALIRAQQEGANVDSDSFAEVLRQYIEQVIKPRVAAAGESCANGQLAIQTVLGFERQVQLLGTQEDLLAGVPDLPELVETVARVCVIEEFELCVEEHIIHRMFPVWLGFERQFQLLGGLPGDEGAALREARDLTVKCLTFRLEFESTGTLDLVDSGYDSSVTSEITLRFNPDGLKISGEAPLVNTEFEYSFASCNVTTTRGGGTFLVFDLMYEGAPGASAQYDSGPEVFGHITDFTLTYHPGTSGENATANCPRNPPLSLPPHAWSVAFGINHADELTEVGLTAINWKILGGELFAQREWDLANAQVSEEGSFELYHTPGQ